jgi:hypothetical protein
MLTKDLKKVTLKRSEEKLTGKMALSWSTHCLRNEEFTYDNDATYIDSNKENAEFLYQKERQFSGLLGFIAELDICVTADFRKGNVSPCDGILNQLISQAKAAGKKMAVFSSDSAARSNDIFRECDKEGG